LKCADDLKSEYSTNLSLVNNRETTIGTLKSGYKQSNQQNRDKDNAVADKGK